MKLFFQKLIDISFRYEKQIRIMASLSNALFSIYVLDINVIFFYFKIKFKAASLSFMYLAMTVCSQSLGYFEGSAGSSPYL